MPFQRHSCPGPDFEPEKGKKAFFSRNLPSGNGIFAIFSDYQHFPTHPARLLKKKNIDFFQDPILIDIHIVVD
jgi:hypothetical protein